MGKKDGLYVISRVLLEARLEGQEQKPCKSVTQANQPNDLAVSRRLP